MISLSEARRIITAHVPAPAGVPVPLGEAAGLVLAADVLADGFYPAGDRSQMDGYALRADATPGTFRVAGEIPAGAVPVQPLQEGEAFRIFTGALLPPGGGRVVMQEDVERDGDTVTIGNFGPSLFIRRKGVEASPGSVVLPAGTVLGAVEIAILAQVGVVRPVVVPPPVVRHLATGGELVDAADMPGPGHIRDTNSPLLRTLFRGLGVTDYATRRVPDDLDVIAQAAGEPADLLVISGGASVGNYDFSTEALRRLGYTIHFDRVNIRPGKPLTFATRGGRAAFVLPGNPVSHFVCFQTAVRLAVELALGRVPSWPAVWLDLHGGEPLSADPRETWWPARASVHEGRLVVTPKRWSSSGNTFALTGTNALVLVNSGSPAGGQGLTLLLEPPTN